MALRHVLFVRNPTRPLAVQATERGVSWCQSQGIVTGVVGRGEGFPGDPELVVAVGGDGTVLRAAALVYPREVPLLAAHVGTLGFLAACAGEEIESALAEVAAGQHRIERRARLVAEGSDFTLSALNDAVVVAPGAERFTALDVAVDGEPALSVEGDGVIVSTPTGSTAYALAGGGPVVVPTVPGLLLVPLAPHRLGLRPIVVPQGAEISVRLRRRARILLDGDSVRELDPGAVVRVTTAPTETLLVRVSSTASFFRRVADKLGLSACTKGER